MSEHVFAEELSATITCLHCGEGKSIGLLQKTGSCPERLVIVESFLRSQIITCRKDIVSNFIYK